jgi:hypothetical protein
MPSYNPVNASIQKYYFTNYPFFQIFIYCQQITVPYDGRNETFEPVLEFEFIDLRDADFDQLNNCKFKLPDADCSTYYLEAHARIELKSLFFHNYQNDFIECDLICEIDFEEEGLEIYTQCDNQKLAFKNLKLEILPIQKNN